jgi:dihydrodipicolinate reductase
LKAGSSNWITSTPILTRTSRAVYAKGAVRAARWVVGRPPGVYGIREVLGL